MLFRSAHDVRWRESFGSLSFDHAAGRVGHATVYDLASLTKPIATLSIVLRLLEEGQLRLDAPVASHVPGWRGADRTQVTLQDLLEHASGLPARLADAQPDGRDAFEQAICDTPLAYAPRTRSIYSDLGLYSVDEIDDWNALP